MSFINRKHIKIVYSIFFLVLLNNCQLSKTNKSHGINFIENRGKILIIGKTNKNDTIKIIGNPHTTSITGNNTWIYFERTITRGKLIKLGQNVLKENNILELSFNKYGVLNKKKINNKSNMKTVKYSKKETQNEYTQDTFVRKFLSSVKQKMYGRRKK